jgi:hypothetical protein
MKRPPGSWRTPSTLRESLRQQLNAYTFAATAAGVGLLAQASPTEAEIAYTPTYVALNGVQSYSLDLNHDGIPDFNIAIAWVYCGDACSGYSLYVRPYDSKRQNQIVGVDEAASALRVAAPIWAGRPWSGRNMAYEIHDSIFTTLSSRGLWTNVTDRYLGLRFEIDGKTHYGWARLTVQSDANIDFLEATITGYAYETVPGRPMFAGLLHYQDCCNPQAFHKAAHQPPTLGLLAIGSSRLSVWRPSESASSTPHNEERGFNRKD